MQYRKFSWLVSLVLAALFAFPHATGRYRASTRPVVDFDITVEKNVHRPPVLQIYYDKGKGFREQDSFRVTLPEGGISKHIQAILPATKLYALRLDYLNGPGTVAVSGMKIMDPFGSPLVSHFSAAQFTTFQTEVLQEKEGSLVIQASSQADDPYITLVFESALGVPAKDKIRANVIFGTKIFAILWVVLEILFLLTGKSWLNGWIDMKKARLSS
jgi:hypothetical protein